jgi:hypothetical protein
MVFTTATQHAGYGTEATDYVGPVPATFNTDDLILAQIVANTSTGDGVTTPAGTWPELVGGTGALAVTGSVGYWWGWHRVTAAEAASPPASLTFALGTARTGNIMITRVTGHNPANPFNTAVSSATSSGTTTVVPGVTTTIAGCLLAGGGSLQSGTSESISSPSGWTEDDTTCLLTLGRGQVAGHLQLGAAGATGDQTWNKTSSLAGASFMVALNPAVSAPPPPLTRNTNRLWRIRG